jgi:hypothetical protein
MFIDGIVIGLAMALLRKGKVTRLVELKWKFSFLIIVAFLIQYGSIFAFQKDLLLATPISYLLLIVFCLLNRNFPGFYLMAAGIVLNLLVMVANNGRMPVNLGAAKDLDPGLYPSLVAGEYGKHIGMSGETHLNFLGDFIYLKSPYPHHTIISIGDVIFSIGIIIFMQIMVVHKENYSKKGSRAA